MNDKRPIVDIGIEEDCSFEEQGSNPTKMNDKRPIVEIDIEEEEELHSTFLPLERPPRSQRKKKKAMNETETREQSVCGICLSEDGKAQRGKLDCCEHYFCFGCIMEWAKVESRCPMCKQRFGTIFRPRKTGNGLRGRTVIVPLRDQVYQPSEDDVVDSHDPYADVFCTECNNTGDDNLLLLCDLCDSAAHTYCVGLGRSVPSGDWYCRSCESSRPGHANAQEEEDDDEFVLDFNHNDEIAEEVLIRGMVAESVRSRPARSRLVRNSTVNQVRKVRRRVCRRLPPRLSQAARALIRQPQTSVSNSVVQVSGSTGQAPMGGARTLSGQRMLQERIQIMRENWIALQSGQLQFSSSPFSGTNDRTCNGANRIDQIVSENHLELNREKPSNETDIDKAWVMMEKAKSLGGCGPAKKIESSNWGSFRSHAKGQSSEIRCNSTSRVVCSKSNSFDGSDLRASSSSVTLQNNSVSSGKPQGVLTESQRRQTIEREGIPTLWPCSEHSTSKAVILSQVGDCQKNGSQGPMTMTCREEIAERSKHISCKEGGRNLLQEISKCSNTLRVSAGTSSSGCDLNDSARIGLKHNEIDVGAKNQVMSLVKNQLKPIYKNKQLGALQFKEIARLSTHTILAACGLGHSEHKVQPFQKVHCCHTGQQCQSSLMPGCCTECFDSFVKELVNRIACENLSIHL